MIEEIENKESEERLIQKVKSKKRIRGLLIGINTILACYLVFEIITKINDFVSSSTNESDIIPLNGNSRTESLSIYDKYLLKDNQGEFLTSDAYDFGIYGGYLHLSDSAMTVNSYHSFKNTSLINVTTRVQTSLNQITNSEYLNGGINLTSLEVGDYLVFDEYITEQNFSNKHKAIKLRSERGIEKTIYSLPKENGYRKKITIKSKDSSPSLVISVSEINSLPKDYYDFVFIGDDDNVNEYLNKMSSNLKVLKTKSLLEAFKTKSNYCFSLLETEKIIAPKYINISASMIESIEYKDDFLVNDYSFGEYAKELGGYLTNSGSCQKGQESTFITKPYLEGNDVGKVFFGISSNTSFDDIKNLI